MLRLSGAVVVAVAVTTVLRPVQKLLAVSQFGVVAAAVAASTALNPGRARKAGSVSMVDQAATAKLRRLLVRTALPQRAAAVEQRRQSPGLVVMVAVL
jgi:hypothetical protein